MSGDSPRHMVKREALSALAPTAREFGVSLEDLFAGHRHLLHAPPEWVEWDEYVELLARLAEQLGNDPDKIFRSGQIVAESAPIRRYGQALTVSVRPELVFLQTAVPGYRRYFPHLTVEPKIVGRSEVLVEMALPPDARPSKVFFNRTAGVLSAIVRWSGHRDMHVTWETDGRRATYRLRSPKAKWPWESAFAWIRVALNRRDTIRELERQEGELLERQTELSAALDAREKALTSRDRFLRMMSHELRTPMNGLSHGLSELESESQSPETLEALLVSGQRLLNVLNAVLTYNHLSTEAGTNRPQPTLIVSFLEDLTRSASKCNVDVKVEPPTLRCALDRENAGFAINELVANARTVSPPERPVEVRAHRKDDVLTFEVLDRGPGMPDLKSAPTELAELDGQDRHLETARRYIGIGLRAVEKVAERLDGRLTFAARVGGGTVATLQLPFLPVPETPPPTVARSRPSVLVVDDNRVNRMVAKKLLTKLDCRVDEAEDGRQALERMSAEAFDLILMDCDMPVLDGWAATREARAMGFNMPIIALTAFTAESDRQRCFEAGMDAFLAKPIDRAMLGAMLAEHLGLSNGP